MDVSGNKEVSADILSEFFEVAIHCVLYCRGLYPPGVFGLKRKYNVPVQMCLHPEVSQYVGSIITSLKQLFLDQAVDRIAIVIIGQDNHPLEKFIFDIEQKTHRERTLREDNYLLHLEQSLRALLLRLNVSDALLESAPCGCTWTVHVYTKTSAASKAQEEQVIQGFVWMEADEEQQQISDPRIIPLKSLNSHLFRIQMFAEESGKES